ncbi:cupin domain-containing protein [Actinotalea sp.]|uniref:cupin domain-containing protein n=1 Tax=Actinotalea sp. TaxID=1872145 RepID=UPI003566B672
MRAFTIPSSPDQDSDSSGVTLDLLPGAMGASNVNVTHIAAGGTLGTHAPHHRQVFAVVSGRGRIQLVGGESYEIEAGMLVLWEAGEVHQTWATTEMTVVVMENLGVLDFAGRFPEIDLGATVGVADG